MINDLIFQQLINISNSFEYSAPMLLISSKIIALIFW